MAPFGPETHSPTFLDKLIDILAGVGQRIAVHLFALVIGIFAGGTTLISGNNPFAGASLAFSVYIGIICLIPGRWSRHAEYLVPSASGLLLALLWASWGVPWQYSCIWGGALTWTIRRILRKGQIDWEWSVLPWLLICLYASFANVLSRSPVPPPLWLFPVLAAGGWGVVKFYSRYRGNAAQRSILLEACGRLEKKLSSRGLPEELDQAVARLAVNIRRFLKLSPRLGTDSAEFVSGVRLVAERIASLGGIAGNDGTTQKYLLAIDKLERDLAPRLASLERQQQPESLQAAVDKALAGRIEEFRKSAMRLQSKSSALPLKVRSHVDGILLGTEKLAACMRDDPQDVPIADRFLSRYLKAAHTLVDEYARLHAQNAESRGIAEALARSEELLERLQKAFEEEHVRLLQNDAINFTAELNVLDKLLKMDGR